MFLPKSGKTSFITSLSGRAYYGQRTGKVKLNGQENDLTRFKKLVGFVPQNDIMLPSMTVYETLYFAAKCRLDKSKTNEQVENLVSSIISVLGLEDVKHSLIGDEKKRGISGGQKKRVNIGMELAAVPSVLFCKLLIISHALDKIISSFIWCVYMYEMQWMSPQVDVSFKEFFVTRLVKNNVHENTKMIRRIVDSSTSKEIIEILKSIAVNQHLTIVTVIHQPRYEIFTMFHKVMLLGKGGRIVYFGPSVKAMDYFESLGFKPQPNVNPADFMLDIISGNVTKEEQEDSFFDPELLFDMWEERAHLWSGELNSDETTELDSSPLKKSLTNVVEFEESKNNEVVDHPLNSSNISHQEEEEFLHEASLSPPRRKNSIMIDCSYTALQKEHNSRHVSYLSQFMMCLKRCLFQSTREIKSFVLDCFLVYIAGLAIGVIFYDTRYIGPPLTEIIEQCPEGK